tara:strand:+ start:289 stop:1056 length:768 start_codon:yes stop_codon:yes gene_type:complete
MSKNSLVRKAVVIDKFISDLGLTPSERSGFVADRLTIEKYIPKSSCVLEIGSRPSVSLFIEKRKDKEAKHIVLDNTDGDRKRLTELIKMNKMNLEVTPMEDFIDIYSYDTIVTDDINHELTENLTGFPMDVVKYVIIGENNAPENYKKSLHDFMVESGFSQTEVVMERVSGEGKRGVLVFKRIEKDVVSKAASPKKEAAAPKKEAAAPKKEAAAPKKEAAAPKKEAASSSGKLIFNTRTTRKSKPTTRRNFMIGM